MTNQSDFIDRLTHPKVGEYINKKTFERVYVGLIEGKMTVLGTCSLHVPKEYRLQFSKEIWSKYLGVKP